MKTIFGLCCQSHLFPKLSAKSTTTLTYLNKLSKAEQSIYLIGKAKTNIKNLHELLKKTKENGIQAFRLSDSFIPMGDLGLFDIEKELGDDL